MDYKKLQQAIYEGVLKALQDSKRSPVSIKRSKASRKDKGKSKRMSENNAKPEFRKAQAEGREQLKGLSPKEKEKIRKERRAERYKAQKKLRQSSDKTQSHTNKTHTKAIIHKKTL